MITLIGACLLAVSCRYDGRSVPLPERVISELKRRYRLIPVCPEIMGGLPTPRSPAEILRGQEKVIQKGGADVTEAYRRGAEETLRLAQLFGCKLAILKERSPSCGKGRIHDGSFSGAMIDGDGITAALLRKNGIEVIGESEIPRLLSHGAL